MTAEQVATPQIGQVLVQLTSIKNLKHVNALAENKTLSLGLTGLTAIYGDNGVGKSGYTRVLKKACRARDQSETVRPNAYKPPPLAGTASAEFGALVDGQATEYRWIDGRASPPELSSIAIFDSRCARAYVDNQGDFSYVPYGLDILEGLASVCGWLKEQIGKELPKARPNLEAFAKLALSPTHAGTLAKNLSAKTSKDEIERLATLSEQELAQIESLSKTLGEADPKKKAGEFRVKASRLDSLVQRLDAAVAIVTQPKLDEVHSLVDKSNSAKAVAQAAAERFRQMDTLEGTGSDA